jgi:excisionase family DNA binding protein
MKAEFVFPQELSEEIADRVVEQLKVILGSKCKHHEDDTVFDKKGLSAYLKLSTSTIDRMVCNKEIPHFKIQSGQSGGVRFFKRDIDRWISKQTIPEINQFHSRR